MVACLAFCVGACGPMAKDPGAGAPQAPEFTFRPLDDSPALPLSSYRGKVVVLKFWATWCSDCVKEMPKNAELAKHFAKNPDVVFLGLAHPKGGADAVTGMAFRNRIEYPQMLDEAPEGGKRIAELYGVDWIPTVVFVDRKGRIRGRQKSIEGMAYLNAKVTIQKLLEEG